MKKAEDTALLPAHRHGHVVRATTRCRRIGMDIFSTPLQVHPLRRIARYAHADALTKGLLVNTINKTPQQQPLVCVVLTGMAICSAKKVGPLARRFTVMDTLPPRPQPPPLLSQHQHPRPRAPAPGHRHWDQNGPFTPALTSTKISTSTATITSASPSSSTGTGTGTSAQPRQHRPCHQAIVPAGTRGLRAAPDPPPPPLWTANRSR